MNKKTVILAIICLLIIAGVYFFSKNSDREILPENGQASKTSIPGEEPNPASDHLSQVYREGLTVYTNNQYGFTFDYPMFYAYTKFTANTNPQVYEAGSEKDVPNSQDYLRVVAIKGSLDGVNFFSNDGSASGVFVYSAKQDSWIYKGFTGYSEGDHPIVDSRLEDGAMLQSEGYTPQKYTTKNGLLAWVGKSTDAHSTQGGCIWQEAFVPDSRNNIVVKIYIRQAHGLSCVGAFNNVYPYPYKGTDQTIYQILDTLVL